VDVEPKPLAAQPPLLQAPVPTSGAVSGAANGSVDGETHGSGEPALAPTPTPDDIAPPDADGIAAHSLPGAPAGASAAP
jgi:penicillin-binding protein 1A